jgi:4-hydroxybenzoate polyprenyltransferase
MSVLELLLAYLKQRARLRLFVPLSIVLALAGPAMVPFPNPSITAITLAALQALGLALAFRIWDDVQDRDVDRTRHPERVTTTAPTTAPLYALAFGLFLCALVPLLAAPFALRRVVALSLVTAMLASWYRVRSRDRSHALEEHVLTIKYPVIAYAVAPILPPDVLTPRVGAILVVLYLFICVYEYAEDVELRQIFTSRRSLS